MTSREMASSCKELEKKLCEAAENGNVQAIVRHLEQRADIDAAAVTTATIILGPLTPLMWASRGGHVECVKVLLDRGALVNVRDNKDGRTALMRASFWGHKECVKVLLDRGALVNMQNKEGDTALHLAARKPFWLDSIKEDDKATCVKALLSHPGIDINIKNNKGRTAMMDAGYKSLGTLKPCMDFPADSYGKVVLCGNSGAGKSTLTQAIINISKPTATRLVKRILGREEVVEPYTAGIIPHQIDSPYGNMVVYDLAGHHQYFSSHSACLEAISLNSPAIFLLLQDLRKNPESMTKEVYYWSTMIDGVCHKSPQQSSVLVVGTHADLLTQEQQKEKMSHLQSIAKMAISHQILVNVLTLNVTKIHSGEMDKFKALLYGIIKDVLSMSPPIPVTCHMLLAFLKERLPDLEMDAISLSDLMVHLKADPDKLIDPDSSNIIPLLEILSEKGLILFIPSEDPLNSWIVLHKESILKKVNGALFADPSLKEYIHVASNTGIVPKAVIKKIFPKYNIEMLTQFMIHFELCQTVDLSQVATNMAPEGSFRSDLGPLFFFPALVNVDRPSSATVPNNSFRWSMIVKSANQFFTTRCLHVLLRRLPSEFALPAVLATPLHSHRTPSCDVWSRGIKWLSETGVTTIVEMSESFQSLSLAMSSHDKTDHKYLQLVHSVLTVNKNTCAEFCPHLEVLEVISCPPEASSDHSDDTQVELSSLIKALLEGDKSIVDVKRKKYAVIEEWTKKHVEPCLSYLVGVSPMAPSSSTQPMSKMVGLFMTQLEGTPTLMELLSFTDKKVNIAEQIGVNYLKFGIFLLKDSDGVIVKALEKEHLKNAEEINMAILQRWLQGKGVKPVTWSTLMTVLQNVGM
ncbi:hypothetical protein EMCRGX_G028135 [Ephydatia muelleri]